MAERRTRPSLTPPDVAHMVRAVVTPAVSGLSSIGKGASKMSNDGKPDDRSTGEMSPSDREAIRKRASELGNRLEEAKHRHDPPATGRNQGQAMAMGLKAASELIGGVVVGSGIGWLLDRWLGTWPGFFVLFFLLGAVAGMLGIIRMAQRQKTPPGLAAAPKDDGDDN